MKRAAGAAKAGHSGTLDPFATGLLLVCLGRATKLAGYLTGEDKRYRATVCLGVATDTDDSTGKEIARADASAITKERVEAALGPFRGTISQVPPAFSAIQKDGQRMYDKARRGEAVEIAPREVVVHELVLESFAAGVAILEMRVSKGTYVRSIARDLGKALGAGGHLTALRRIASGSYRVEDASPLEAIKAGKAPVVALDRIVLPMPQIALSADEAEKIVHGVLPARRFDDVDGLASLVSPEGRLLAVGRIAAGRLVLERVL